MLESVIVSGVTMVACIAVQSFIVSILLRLLFVLDRRRLVRPTIFRAFGLLATVMLVMLTGHLLQIALWAGVFCAYGEFDDFGTAFYHSTVNFATLGYGDIVMSRENRLLGALEAANGVLMLGLTTGVLFAVMEVLIRREWERRVGTNSERDMPPEV
jgi:hypothetical protein